MEINKKLKRISWVAALSAVVFSPKISFAAAYTYKLMENIPGFENTSTDLPEYMKSIYRFGLWSIGIAALLMITLGGFMYITSAGNSNSTGKAKKFITDAIAGLILAFVAYLLLYTINPDLVQIRLNNFNSSGTSSSTGGTTTGGGGTNANISKICPDPNSTTPIVFSNAASDSSISLNPVCGNYDSLFNKYASQYGIDKCILKTIAQIESSCGTNTSQSNAGSCGMMQLLPATAGVSCNQLGDKELSIKLAAKYISDNSSRHNGNIEKIFAGYNGGYATSGSGPLAPSVDCPGSLKFQCCKDPQGLAEAIKYAWNGYGLYQKCKGVS